MKTEFGKLLETYVRAEIHYQTRTPQELASHARMCRDMAADDLDEWINANIEGNKVSLAFLHPRD